MSADVPTGPGIKDGQNYSMLGYYNHDNYLHLSYEDASGWCRQVYDKASDSKFQFTVNNADNNTWFIQNKSEGRRLGHWLSYDKEWVGLWTNPINRAVWKAKPVGKMKFKFQCYWQGKDMGWLSFKWNGRWNALHEKESDAAVYELKAWEN